MLHPCPAALLALLVLPASMGAENPPEIAWQKGDGFRWLALQRPGAEAGTGFTRMDSATLGILWTNVCSPDRYARRQNLMNGAGLALGDYDGDGWCDLYLCTREGSNALYRNLGGWRFLNVTDHAGVGATNLISSGALFLDVNGDGRLDLHVTSFLGPDALFLNRGDGTFEDVTAASGVSSPGGATSSAAADLDGDGDLDLYVARFAVEALLRDGTSIATRMVNGQPVVTGRSGRRVRILNNKLYENGEPDLLLINDGRGRFSKASWPDLFTEEDGRPLSETPGDLGFTVQLRDINGDGAPDIYVCNDFQTPDRIWLGDGRGKFRAMSSLALRNMSYASMGVDFADLDRDGHLDFYTVEMLPREHFRHLTHVVRGADPDLRQPRNPRVRDAFSRSNLAWNRGDGTYAEIAWFAGVATSDWSWTPIFLDVDLDGFEDLLISSGYPHDVNHLDFAGGAGRGEGRRFTEAFKDQLLRYPPLDSPQLAWRNRGDLTFEDTSEAWRFHFRVVTHGMALADLDNDGDLDVVGNAFNAAPVICRNDSAAPRVAVRLKGQGPNTGGIGAQVRLLGGPTPVQAQEMLAGGRYLSCDQGQRTFAAAPARGPLVLEVHWRSGRASVVNGVQPGRLYECDEAGAQPARPSPAPAAASPPMASLFEAVPFAAPLVHEDPPFDELGRQALLPWRQGFQGPGLLWYDRDDGKAEIVMGNGRGAAVLGAQIGTDGTAIPGKPGAWGGPLPDDALGLLGLVLTPGRRDLFVGLANYETGATNQPAALRFIPGTDGSSIAKPLPGGGSSPGPLAAGDLDGDGDLDLVVAGRMIAGRYPEPADTRIFRNDAGEMVFDAAASAPLARAGLVTGVLFADLTGDGRPELVLACEWGPLRLFRFDAGVPREWNAGPGLSRASGLWQGVAAADFDGDGRIDLAAANWGRNSPQQRGAAGPWQLAYADLDGDGRVSIVEGYHDDMGGKTVPFRPRDLLATELPWLPATFPKHVDYARATLVEVLGPHASAFATVEATTCASSVFFNRGDHFEIRELPREAQWTPIFGFATADFDGDGDEDLFCAQNFFDVRDEDDRIDAGRGLLLLNDGKGGFRAASSAESGLLLYGEQRGAAVADFDGDGRPDLAVAQNGGPVVILKNRKAIPGLRVRLRGAPSNPDGIGARVRLLGPEWQGPLREVRAGSGRFSQDSCVQVLGGRGRARQLWVQFPGSGARTLDLPEDAADVTVDAAAGLRVNR